MDLCGETNYKLLPHIYHLVCPGLASLCSANEFSSNCPIAASSWVNSLHLFHGTRWILVGKPTHHTCSLCAVVIAGWQGLSSNISAREGTALKMSTHSWHWPKTLLRAHCLSGLAVMGFVSFKQNYGKLWFSQLDLHDVEPDLGRVLMCFCGGSVSDILLFCWFVIFCSVSVLSG